jgi:hypothetical protein
VHSVYGCALSISELPYRKLVESQLFCVSLWVPSQGKISFLNLLLRRHKNPDASFLEAEWYRLPYVSQFRVSTIFSLPCTSSSPSSSDPFNFNFPQNRPLGFCWIRKWIITQQEVNFLFENVESLSIHPFVFYLLAFPL